MTSRSWLRRYIWAVLGTGIAVVCRLLLDPVLGNTIFYGSLYVAVAASAVFGGLGPAILAAVLGAFAADYFFIPPRYALGLNAEDHIGFALFLIVSSTLIGLAEKQRRERNRQMEAQKREQAEALRASEERFRRLVEVSAQTVWAVDGQEAPKIDSSTWSPLAEKSAQHWLGVPNWLEAAYPEDRERATTEWLDAVKEKKPYEVEVRLRNVNGECRYVVTHAAPVFNPDGTVREWIGMSADVTERKRTEIALALAIQRLDAHINNSPLAVIECDEEFRIKRWSEEAEQLFGWSAQEILGRTIAEVRFVYEEDSEPVQQICLDMLEGRRPRNVHANRNYCKDGSIVECEWYNSAIYGKEGKLSSVLSQVLDVTARKRTEEQLRQAQKMESIGLLAGGVAHDFNNLLAGMIGNASLAIETVEGGSPAEDLLERIIKSGERAAHLTAQLLAYSGKGRFVVEPVDLSKIVREVTDLLGASVPKKIGFQLDLSANLPAVKADRSQVHQILMNLVINAAEAIGDEAGTIAVRTGLQNVDDKLIREVEAESLSPGPHVVLEVRDTGAGMDEVTKQKIFDPFFTTKFTGRGLGLAAVSGIVRGHNGAIRVETSPGKGTCFTVFLPALTEMKAATEEPERAGQKDQELRGAGTILFADDEEALRMIAKRGLERYGFRVLLAANGKEAVEALNAASSQVDLVVLDLSMPLMSGEEALPELQKAVPGVRVLVSSGYGKDEALGKFGEAGVAGFLQKPYTIQQLLQKVNKVCGARRAGSAAGRAEREMWA